MPTPTSPSASSHDAQRDQQLARRQPERDGTQSTTSDPVGGRRESVGPAGGAESAGGNAGSPQPPPREGQARSELRPQITGYMVAIGMVGALAGFLFGFDTGVVSGAQLFYTRDFHMRTGEQELSVGAVLIGTVIGAALAGLLADRLGRRRALIVMAVIFGSGAILTALSWSAGSLIVFRIYKCRPGGYPQ